MNAAGAVRPKLEAQEARLLDLLEHDGARSVPEEDERPPVGPVENP
jgi:hypothetical protein